MTMDQYDVNSYDDYTYYPELPEEVDYVMA